MDDFRYCYDEQMLSKNVSRRGENENGGKFECVIKEVG